MLVFENVYQKISPELKLEAANLWKNEGVLIPAHELETRLNQMVFIIRDVDSGVVTGVSSAENKKVPALNNRYLYEFRCFIGEHYRMAGLDVKLSRMTFDFLESIRDQAENKPIGVFSILESEVLKQERVWRRAVWPELEMYFVGYTKSGNPIRVHYFSDARI